MPAFQIFKPDTSVTSMEGVSISLTPADLKGIADRYDPKVHEAPIIIGHPQHDAPAYGWVSKVSFADNALAVDERQVDPAFAALREAGRYKKVSARFFTPTAKNNPTPGQWYLRDVGFLGAMPPAVKGLQTFSFGDDAEQQVVTAEISFGDMPAWSGTYIAQLFRGLRDWLIEKEGKDVADKVAPDYAIQSIADMSTRADAATSSELGFSDTDPNHASKEKLPMKTAEQLQADLDAANKARDGEKARADALEAAERVRQAGERHAQSVSFADALVAEAKWPAGAKDVLVATLDHLSQPVDTGVVSFGEGTAAKPLHQVLREQLQALPPQVSFGEHVRRGSGGNDAAPEAIAAKAVAFQQEQAAKGITVNTAQAVEHVSQA